ncbi:hypothetical protein [uncultured Leifsonia sp.]|uniref:hypothetical protein n=1 Tax=uncultured Leifsonia sp. TaxID=340359 RepID=UPI0028D310D9|nr:hypothetical protein [uncultured Leifsonia sp.]
MTDTNDTGDTRPTTPLAEVSATAPTERIEADSGAPAEPWLAAPATSAPAATIQSGHPPIRWGGVVWGLILLAFSALILLLVSSPARLAATVEWFSALTPGTAWALWIGVVGLIIAVSAVLGAVNASQRRRRRHPA